MEREIFLLNHLFVLPMLLLVILCALVVSLILGIVSLHKEGMDGYFYYSVGVLVVAGILFMVIAS